MYSILSYRRKYIIAVYNYCIFFMKSCLKLQFFFPLGLRLTALLHLTRHKNKRTLFLLKESFRMFHFSDAQNPILIVTVMVIITKIKPFFRFQFPCSGAQTNLKESIDIPSEPYEIRQVFLRSGFADQRNGQYRLRPCATGTFVNSSESSPTCKKCTAGKLQ